jgi:hypothetical protein
MPGPRKAVDISTWIEKARTDPIRYRQRQVTEILLAAISLVTDLKASLYLKGGILMNLVYDSPRNTSDVDFTTTLAPEEYQPFFQTHLDQGMRRAAARLGYTDLVCKVQSVKTQPREFVGARFPALSITIGSARRGTNEERRLNEGQAPQTLQVDITFHEPVENIEIIQLDPSGDLNGYALTEVIAEKLRALLQQKQRNRVRRQDVYDIAYLIDRFPLDEKEQAEVLRMFLRKSRERDIAADRDSLSDPEIAARARSQWESMQAELDHPLPDFDASFAAVEAFYRALPWDA